MTDMNEGAPVPVSERLQALAMLVPAALLGWPGPGTILAKDFVPHLTGTGAAALASLPAAFLLIFRAAPGRVRGLFLLLVALLFATLRADTGDTLEASRALILGWTGPVLLLSGASLGPAGRRIFARGAVVIALLLLVPAHFDREDLFTGALGNTGSVSQSALAGALIGGVLAIREQRVWRALGISALALSLAYTLRVPVHAGALSAAFALGAFSLLQRTRPRAVRIAFALVALVLTLAVGVRVRSAESTAAPAVAATTVQATPVPASNAGGIAVRASLARASFALFADHPWLGVGPGQFAVAFPPYREPAEIERSTHGRALSTESEVEHPHDDWLLFLTEGGLIAGIPLLAFLVLVAFHARRHLRTQDPLAAAFATAALGLLANAAANAVLSHDPTAATLAFGVFGCVLGDADDVRAPWRRRMLAVLAAAVLALQAPRAWALFAHGRALATFAEEERADAAAIDRALAVCPDSVLARTLRARSLAATGAERDQVNEAWESVLELRPQRFEALMQLGVLAANERTQGSAERARVLFDRARKIDPRHPGLLRNMGSLAFEEGRVDEGFGWLSLLDPAHAPSREWLIELAADVYLRGRESAADALFARTDPGLIPASPERAYAEAKRHRTEGRTRLADALLARAHRTWAREHAAAELFVYAVPSYRQELRISRDYVPGGAPNVRLEFAAALLASGDAAEARSAIAGVQADSRMWQQLPAWASAVLNAAGWSTMAR